MIHFKGISPSKRLGQVFLKEKKSLKKIVNLAKVSKNDLILEIGPGPGNLTLELAKKAKKVVAVEKDKKMCDFLEEVLEKEGLKNVEIVNEDILEFLKKPELSLSSFKVVANIPYYLTSRLIRLLLESKEKPSAIFLLVQKEVAQRICAKPPRSNLLAISVQFFAKARILSLFKKEVFWPKPKVDSALLEILPKKEKLNEIDESLFFKILRAGFFQPRKLLLNNLALSFGVDKIKVEEWLDLAKIEKEKRPGELSLTDWISLTRTFHFFEKN
jgi:16S rRNA (adenine1518-N6/adenine1519-N6)-dimethyltransferase